MSIPSRSLRALFGMWYTTDTTLFYLDVQCKKQLDVKLKNQLTATTLDDSMKSALMDWQVQVNSSIWASNCWEQRSCDQEHRLINTVPDALLSCEEKTSQWSKEMIVGFFERGVCASTEILAILMKQVMLVGHCGDADAQQKHGPFIGKLALQSLAIVLQHGQDSFVASKDTLSGAVSPLQSAGSSLFMGPVVKSMISGDLQDIVVSSFLRNFFDGQEARSVRSERHDVSTSSCWLTKKVAIG